jgi:hypothetical protein
MKRNLLTLAGALFVALAAPATAQPQQTPPGAPEVVVRGEGIVRMAPDRALVRLGAESRSRVPKEAQSATAGAMSSVLQKIAALGIPGDAVRTLSVSLQQEFDYAGGRQTPRGYVARNLVEVRVDDLARLGEVLDASVASGATAIHGLSFDLKQRTELEREALTRAVADAAARAAAAAAGANRTVDRIVRIIEERAGPVVRPQEFAARIAADAAPPTTPVAEGEIEIRVAVTLAATLR